MDYLGDNDKENVRPIETDVPIEEVYRSVGLSFESGEQQSASVALEALKSPSRNDTTDNETKNVISSSPRNDTTGKDFGL